MICKYCEESLPLEVMTKDHTRPKGYKDYCKPCYNARAKEHRKRNPESYNAAQKRFESKKDKTKKPIGLSYKDKRAALDGIKTSRGCFFCGESTAVCLDFHHRNAIEKSFTISKHFHRDFELLVKEIEKCEVVCANCHRKIHHGLINL